MVQINNNAQPVAEGAYDAPVVGLIRVQNNLLQISVFVNGNYILGTHVPKFLTNKN